GLTTLASDVSLPFPFVTNCVTIRGTLIIDRPVTFFGGPFGTTVDVFMGAGAHIIVRPGEALLGLAIFSGASIRACEGTMWRGITVENGGQLFFEFSEISDAQYAIEALDGSRFFAGRNIFNNNYVGIFTPVSTDGVQVITLSNSIVGNEFSTNTNLLPPFASQTPAPGDRSFAGIFINDAIGLSVGNANDANLPNTFLNLRNGIIANRSVMEIYDANISTAQMNCPIDELSSNFFDLDHLNGFGVYAVDCPNVQQRNCILNQCCFGTYVESTDVLNLEGNDYQEDITYGIRLNQVGSFFTQNTIVNNQLKCKFRGIEAFNAIFPKELNIDNNVKIQMTGARSKAISLENVVSSPSSFVTLPQITNNVIELKEGAGEVNGIHVNISFHTQIINNQITGEDPPSDFSDYMLITGSQRCAFYNNTVSGTSNGDAGMRVINSSDNDYCCNVFNKLEDGVIFSGDCDDTQFRQSRFTGPFSHGLRLGESTLTGQQVHAGNLWEGTFSTLGAVHQDPFPENILASRFIVDPQDANSNTLPTFMAASNNWFSIFPGITPFCATKPECGIPLPSPVISPSDLYIAEGGNNNLRLGVLWEGEKRLLQKLVDHPELLGQSTEIDDFHTNKINQSQGLFNAVQKDIQVLFQINEQTATDMAQQYHDIEQILLSVQQNDLLLMTAGESEREILITTKEALLTDLKNVLILLHDKKENINLQRQQNAIQAQLDNSVINGIEIYESNEKTVNNIYLKWIIDDNLALTANEKVLLESIAEQCPLDGGNAVFTARSLLRNKIKNVHVDNESNCSTLLRNQPKFHLQNEQVDTHVKVYPNPASDFLNIDLNAQSINNVFMRVYNTLGHIVMEKTITPGNNRLNLSALSNGIYLINVVLDHTLIETEKISILR
ncbi:MAG: T9SS type A sorting domain-containing protein, partial [Bacteroidota bacterium]